MLLQFDFQLSNLTGFGSDVLSDGWFVSILFRERETGRGRFRMVQGLEVCWGNGYI